MLKKNTIGVGKTMSYKCVSPRDLSLFGILISLILTVFSFQKIDLIYLNQFVLTIALSLVVVSSIFAYANRRFYFPHLILAFCSFSMMNIVYVYLYKPSILMIPNMAICFLVFVNYSFYPKLFAKSLPKMEIIAEKKKSFAKKLLRNAVVLKEKISDKLSGKFTQKKDLEKIAKKNNALVNKDGYIELKADRKIVDEIKKSFEPEKVIIDHDDLEKELKNSLFPNKVKEEKLIKKKYSKKKSTKKKTIATSSKKKSSKKKK